MANEPMQSSDLTSGLIRRRMPLELNKLITNAEKQKWEKLGGIEHAMSLELSGLLNWVLDMTNDDFKNTLQQINNGLTATQKKRLFETNSMARWISDCLLPSPSTALFIGKKLPKPECPEYPGYPKLYPNYQYWCEGQGCFSIALNRFSSTLLDTAATLKIKCRKLPRSTQGFQIQGFAIRKNDDPFHEY